MTFVDRLITCLHPLSRKKPIPNNSSILGTKLSRCLTTLDLTLLGIGGTLGAGVYVLTGTVARNYTGPAIIISFLIAGIASIVSGLCYAEFGARVPKAGSAYIYSFVTIGELCAFVVGWNLILEYIIGAASVCRGLSGYLNSLLDDAIQNATIKITGHIHIPGASSYLDLFAFFFAILITIILCFNIKNTANIVNIFTTINMIVILMVIVMGAFYVNIQNWDNFTPYGVNGIVKGASSCFYAFVGFDIIATASEEAKNPNKTIPRAIIFTIGICAIAYLGTSGITTLMVPYNKLDTTAALSEAFEQNHSPYGKYIIGVGSVIGMMGNTFSSMLPLPRLLYSMGSDGIIFKFFGIVNQKTEIPIYGTIISGLFTAVMAMVFNIQDLVEMMSIGTLLAYTIVITCVLLLRYRVEFIGLSDDDNDDLVPYPKEEIEENEHLEHGIKNGDVSSEIKSITEQSQDYPAVNTSQHTRMPTNRTQLIVTTSTLLIFATLVAMTMILALLPDRVYSGDPVLVSIVLVLLVIVIGLTILVAFQPQNPTKLHFKSPWLPYLPVIGLFFNLYLIFSLQKLTWIRFGVWLGIGGLVYFGYGIRKSSARTQSGYESI